MFFKVFIPTGGYKCFSKNSPEKEAEYNQIYQAFTTDVKDCVVVYIKGKNLNIFVHFYRKSDPIEFLKKLLRDIDEDEELEIALSGGKFVNGYFPWDLKKRRLFSEQKETIATSFQKDLQDKAYPLFFIGKKVARESIIALYKALGADAFEPEKSKIDFSNFHDKIKNFKLDHLPTALLIKEGQERSFQMKNGKDTTSYQNLAAVLEMISLFSLLRPTVEIKKIHHTYNPNSGRVYVKLMKDKPEHTSVIVRAEKIKYQEALRPRTSLKKSLQLLELISRIKTVSNLYQRSKLIGFLSENNVVEALKFASENELFDVAQKLIDSMRCKENNASFALLDQMKVHLTTMGALKNNKKLKEMDSLMNLIDKLHNAEEVRPTISALQGSTYSLS